MIILKYIQNVYYAICNNTKLYDYSQVYRLIVMSIINIIL